MSYAAAVTFPDWKISGRFIERNLWAYYTSLGISEQDDHIVSNLVENPALVVRSMKAE